MRIEIKGKIITCNVYDVKNQETKEPTGEKRLNKLAFLIDEVEGQALSGEVISPYISTDTYTGPYDFSSFKRFDNVLLDVDFNVFENRKSFKLFNIKKV